MWRNEIVKTLFLDIMPLKRQGLVFTWKSLEHLHALLLRSTVYACGNEESLTSSPTRPSLFEGEGQYIPLPQATMLLEFSSKTGQRKAALLSDRTQDGIKIFIFRYNEKHNRWRWPFIGMHYGPTFHENSRIAIYEPAVLAKLAHNVEASLVHEHSSDVGTALAFLQSIRQGEIAAESEVGKTASELNEGKEARIASPTPSSLARSERNRHGVAPTGKGARRS